MTKIEKLTDLRPGDIILGVVRSLQDFEESDVACWTAEVDVVVRVEAAEPNVRFDRPCATLRTAGTLAIEDDPIYDNSDEESQEFTADGGFHPVEIFLLNRPEASLETGN